MFLVRALVLDSAHPAFAEDGGWRSVGAIVVRRALLGGFGAAVGAVVGAVLGGTMGVLANAVDEPE